MGHNTRCTLRPPPPSSCPSEGREKEEEEVPGCETSEGVSARGEVFGAGGTEPEGRIFFHSLYDLFLVNSSRCAEDQAAQKSQVMSLVQIFPLHLAQVGWGSLSKVDRKASYILPPSPGQIHNSLDIGNERERNENTQVQKLKKNPVHPPKRKHKVSSR